MGFIDNTNRVLILSPKNPQNGALKPARKYANLLTVTIPNLVGMSYATALSTLTGLGLAGSFNKTSGIVSEQSPASGTLVGLGYTVNVVIP
jgi:beta-lactam-binding protein with PASTA domain